jgi:hypothetical protein
MQCGCTKESVGEKNTETRRRKKKKKKKTWGKKDGTKSSHDDQQHTTSPSIATHKSVCELCVASCAKEYSGRAAMRTASWSISAASSRLYVVTCHAHVWARTASVKIAARVAEAAVMVACKASQSRCSADAAELVAAAVARVIGGASGAAAATAEETAPGGCVMRVYRMSPRMQYLRPLVRTAPSWCKPCSKRRTRPTAG